MVFEDSAGVLVILLGIPGVLLVMFCDFLVFSMVFCSLMVLF